MSLGQFNSATLTVLVAVALASSPVWSQQPNQAVEEGEGWVVVSAPQVDLWYHGMAVVGFDRGNESTIYSSEYVDRVRAEKERLGIYPTALDVAADDLRKDLEEDAAFRILHFLPLHFASATPQRMLRALSAIGNREASDSGALGLDTGVGLGFAANALRGDAQRDVLGRFVSALEEEWRVFFDLYWNGTVAPDSASRTGLQSEWDEHAGAALRSFLAEQEMAAGLIFVSPALGRHGRFVRANALDGLDNAVAVWSPAGEEASAIVSAAVREMCFTVVDRGVVLAGVRVGMDAQTVGSRASVRCGALLFEAHNPDFLPEYTRSFLDASGNVSKESDLTDAFEQAYEVDESVIAALQRNISPEVAAAAQMEPPAPSWSVRARPQLDLWYHALATIGVEDEELLPKYNADYAAEMSRIKRDLGVFPTPLDRLSDYFRSELASKREFAFFDEVPLYFPTATPEEMLAALDAVSDRRVYQRDRVPPSAATGAVVATQVFHNNSLRRVLSRFVTMLRQEWEVFYQAYWYSNIDADSLGRAALDDFWAAIVVPRIDDFLERVRIDGGEILVSQPLGPKGRLLANQVVVWLPSDAGPRDAAYNVIKEVCYVLVDEMLEDLVDDRDELPNIRINAAVRCGALVLDYYAPIMSAGYRRVMMRSLGADSVTNTVARFERRFQLEPAVLEALREEIRRRY
jgi:hypothetical protein